MKVDNQMHIQYVERRLNFNSLFLVLGDNNNKFNECATLLYINEYYIFRQDYTREGDIR